MFERFTESARQVVVEANEESRHLGHDFIGSEHLLLGVVRTDAGLLAVSEGELRALVVARIGSPMKIVDGALRFTAPAKLAIERSLGVAIESASAHIGPEHLLLALLEQEETAAIVRECDIAPERVRGTITVLRQARDALDPRDDVDARMLLSIVRRDGRVAVWLRERGIDEAALRERYDGLDLG